MADKKKTKKKSSTARDIAPPADDATVAADFTAGVTGGDTIENLHDTLRYLDDNFNDLSDACKDDDQRTQLRRALLTAHRNYTNALTAVILSNDVHVQELNDEITAGQAKVEQLAIGEANIAQILTTVTAVVRTASALLALVGA
jgi:hypothetical protein